ncbi:hypothetical protein RclHR1_07230009 [Rhizophagus clarus]|uniref:NAD-P-binding protein n=1 Tax=Rhizophagus clarus TaxID=94130 RepID=A0A2Z6SCD5_9GLOM|nr:hypothetical protein RclHR1_07230009 [Rhizophagus clarus]GES85903.1 NAD-P-binding protein [Rhizophagus clarus]
MKVIVTGASGLLGRAVYKTIKETNSNYEVIGLAKSRVKNDLKQLDLTDKSAVESLIEEIKPDVLIHCAAERRPEVVEKNQEVAFELNVNTTENLAKLSLKYKFLLIYISTDYVFDGKNPPYEVDDTPNPINLYGNTKYQGELAIQKINPDTSIILRVPILYGEAESPAESSVNILVDSVKDSSKKADINNISKRYPTNVEDVARVIKDLAVKRIEQNNPIKGISHFSANEMFTKYEICKTFAKILNCSIDHLNPADSQPPSAAAKQPLNSHLSNKRLEELDIDTKCVGFEEWWTKYLGV